MSRAYVLSLVCVFGLSADGGAAGAAVRADFNGDAILDTATVEHGSHSLIEASFSRSGHLLLIAGHERPRALVAADADHDGNIVLAGVTRHKRLFLWRSDGGEHFTRVRVRTRRHRGSDPDLSHPFTAGYRRPVATSAVRLDALNGDDHSRALHAETRVSGPTRVAIRRGQVSLQAQQRYWPTSRSSRAPPR